jgi:hypothetical protein
MTRTEIINREIKQRPGAMYLEVGVYDPSRNFDRIEADTKVGVDIAAPKGHARILRMDSAKFWQECSEKFDVIFIDADHSYESCKADVLGALRVLAPGGAVILHDCLPTSDAEAAPEKPAGGKPWCGEVWRVWRYLRGRKDLVTRCYDCDHGVGVVTRGRGGESVPETVGNTWRNAKKWAGLIATGAPA